jgi:hypothetical protein
MPRLLQTQNINTNAVDLGQGPSVARAGQVYNAIEGVGAKIAGFSEQLAQKRYEAEKKSYISSSANDLERFVSEKETELNAKYTGDPNGLATEMNEALNSWYEERREMAPNDDAKFEWEQRFAEASNNIGQKAISWENKKKVDYQIGLMDNDVLKNGQHLANKPSVEKAAQFITNTQAMVQEGVGLWFDETQAKERLNKYGAAQAKSLMEGLEANKQYGIGMSIFSGKDPNSKIILSNMTPEQIGMYKDRFNKLQQAENEFSKAMFNLEASDISLGLQKGMDIPQDKIEAMVKKSSMLKPEERAVFIDNLNSDLQYNKIIQGMKNLPIEEIQKLQTFSIQRKENDVFNLKSRTEKQEMFQKVSRELYEARVNNAPEYHYQNDMLVRNLSDRAKDPEDIQSVNQYTQTIVAKQVMDKAANPKVLTEEMSQTYASMLKSENPEMVNKAYNTLRSGMQVGERNYARNAIADMVRNKHLDPVQGMALSLEDSNARATALQNLAKRKDIEETFSKAKKEEGEDVNEVLRESSVNSFMNAIQAGSKGSENVSVLNGFNELLVLQYKAERVKGASQKEAKNKAISTVIKDNFALVKGRNSQLIIGREYKNKAGDIESFLKDSMSPSYFASLKVKQPEIYDQRMNLIGKGSEARARYYQDLSQNGEWVLNQAQNGAVLYKRQGDQRVPVLDEDGNRISIPFDKMKASPADAQAGSMRAIANNKAMRR